MGPTWGTLAGDPPFDEAREQKRDVIKRRDPRHSREEIALELKRAILDAALAER